MRIGIDIGGTFTDFVLFDENTGEFQTSKILSTPQDPAEAVLNQLSILYPQGKRVPSSSFKNQLQDLRIVHGSTVATNALLERNGAITALITTAGFRDVLEIGRQNRPNIYDLFSRRTLPLIPPELRFEVDERVDRLAQPIQPLDPITLEPIIEQLRAAKVTSVAVSLLFSFLYPKHEQLIAEALRRTGYFVSLSSEVLPEFREYERTSTTVVNAYVSPVMDRYLARLEQESGAVDFRVMQSNGGSIRAAQARREAVRCVLSGPAGGVVGARYVATAAGFEQLLTFDMGGTSTDVSLYNGDVLITTEAEIDGLPMRISVIDIHTVGSGGGSIAHVDAGGALRVGPQSAGANPGPVCYGQGGQQPTVTDANLILGRLAADRFLGGQMSLDVSTAEATLKQLAQTARLSAHPGLTPAQAAALGVIEVVNAHMERALRIISVQRGHDPREFTLVSFGGAGGLHAIELARSLSIPRVLIPPNAATLSAFGMLTTDVVKDYVQTIMCSGDTPYPEIEALIRPMVERGQADLLAEDIPASEIIIERMLDMRYQGQSYELKVPLSANFVDDFHTAHAYRYGYSEPNIPVEVVNLRLRAVGRLSRPRLPRAKLGLPNPKKAFIDRRLVVLAERLTELPFYNGPGLRPGHQIVGPAVIVHPDTTVFLGVGDQLAMDEYKNLIIDVRPEPVGQVT
jgi:N-methylhydantoinase A